LFDTFLKISKGNTKMFKKKWQLERAPKQNGKIVVITGANSGLGLASAKVFSEKGAEVVLACRSAENAEDAKKEILSELPKAKLNFIELDLQSLDSIKAFSEAFKASYKKLDILMNNAGVMNTPFGQTQDGFELQMGTNHLGHFALTGRLLPLLKKTADCRVITVSSTGHKAGKINTNKLLMSESKYSAFRAYANSKLANLLFAYELERRFKKNKINCESLAAHPGASQTNLGRHIEDAAVFQLLNPVLEKIVQGPEQGALPQLRAAIDTRARGGEYYGPDGLMEMSGSAVRVKSSRSSHNPITAKKLWVTSEKLTQVKYDFST
jgi:NAD(P)-dependent dehydrogenase (short-subunit alcohol dehydrogenase family)